MTSALHAPALLRAPAAASWQLGRRALSLPASFVHEVAGLPRSVARAVVPPDLDRQVWAAGGSAMLQVHGLDRAPTPRHRAALAAALERAVGRVEGVRWARVDPVTHRIAVRFDRDRHTIESVVDVLTEAEELVSAGLGEATEEGGASAALGVLADDVEVAEDAASGGPAEMELPPGQLTAARHAAAAATHLAGLGVAVAGRLSGLPRLPAGAAALVALVEHQPWLRERLDDRLGAARADVLLSTAAAVTNGLTRNWAALVLESVQRGHSAQAVRARADAHAARFDDLHGPHRPEAPVPADADERPVPLPPGPVDVLARRMARGSLVVSAALLAGTLDPDLAGRALLVGVPRPAHAAEQGFVDALAIGLGRRGIVVRDPAALRLLDRVTTVVVESDVLHGDQEMVVDARPETTGWSTVRVWRTAQRLLDGGPGPGVPPSGSPALRTDPATGRTQLTADGAVVGHVVIGREVDPFADAVLSAVRSARLRLVLTEDPTAPELAGRADELLRNGRGAPDRLRREIRRMQAAGEVVALLSADHRALDAADVAIALVPETGPVPWTADLLCGPGLQEVPRLIAAAAAARAVAQRGVRVSLGASFLGALVLALGAAGGGGRAQLPVTMAAGGALLAGIRSGWSVVRQPDPEPVPHTRWHALEPGEVLARLPRPGPGSVPDQERPPPSGARSALGTAVALLRNIRAELADPLTPVLATGAAASAVIGSPTDALLVGGVLAGSATISGAQRMRAERALAELLSTQRLPARLVEADGDRLRVVPATGLRPGHLIDLRAGDVVPADARLLAVEDLEVDEATLTGESTAVTKDTAATPAADLPDRVGMVYEGTTVVAGAGRAVVVAVGPATEAGRALALAGRAGAPAGMQHRLEELTGKALPVTLLGGAAVTGLALLRGRPLGSAIGSGVSVAVAAVPEGLPLMATVAQQGAARRLSRRGVLVRAARTVEALGRVDTVCFDKTGTLTEGHLRLVRVAGLDAEWAPQDDGARRVLRAAARACPSPNGGRALAHATDRAVLDAAQAVLGEALEEAWEELAEVPFHSDRGFSAAVGRTPTKTRMVVKGAPEVLLPRCSHVRDDDGKRPLDREGLGRAGERVHALAARGLRVLAVARRNVGDLPAGVQTPEDVADIDDLTLLGFIGLADTPRPRAAETVAALDSARIATVMITGDHPVTARAVAGSLGIATDRLVTGPELAALDEPGRVAAVTDASVFARVSPEQKLQIIEALRESGRTVAMAGDGANDAAAIRLADVGIGMAARGSTSARTAADLILTEPDLGLILDALVEGRAMWRRVRDGVAVLLGGNAGEVGFTLLGTAIGGRAPITTRQFLVVNMFTDLLPSMALALAPTPTDPAARSDLLAGGPPSLGAPLLRDIGFRGSVTALGALVAWLIGRTTGTRRRAGTIALASLVGAELGQTLLLGGRDPLVLATAVGSAAVLAAIIQIPVVSRFFGCTPLDPLAWAVVVGTAAAATIASAQWTLVRPAGTR